MLSLVCIHDYGAHEWLCWCWHNLACYVSLWSFDSWSIQRTFHPKIFRIRNGNCVKAFFKEHKHKSLVYLRDMPQCTRDKLLCINGDTRNLFYLSQVTAHHLQLYLFSKTHAMAAITEVMLCLLRYAWGALMLPPGNPGLCEWWSLDNFSLQR